MSSMTSEAVLFMGERGVSKAMLYTDFEAILDGMVGMPDLAGREVRCAYCVINGRLQVMGLVLFLIGFDADGMADGHWNIPLRHLVDHAGPGPDMGAGPVRLACRSQCPVAWHQEQLWNPSMKPGHNDFVFIRDTVRERGAKMGLYVEEANPFLAPASPSFGEVPLVQPIEEAPEPGLTDQERLQLARVIKALRLRVKTLESEHEEALATVRYQARQNEDILNTQLEKVLAQFRAVRARNAALKDQNDSLQAQVASLQQTLEDQARQQARQGGEIELLTEQYHRALEQRLEEERARLAAQMHAREMEVLEREDRIQTLEAELAEARREQGRMAHSGAQAQLEQLQALGLSFIAFHPGAGHISIPAQEIGDYMQNPVAFAARKCLVTEDHYRAWLQHYEQPVCQVPLGEGVCGKRVIRIDTPHQFKPGESDRNANRCIHCRCDTALESVIRLK